MCDTAIQQAMLDMLENIHDALISDTYEYSDPFTIGGASGNYQIFSPYNTECEWAILSATGLGTLSTSATFSIGSKNPSQPTLSTTGSDKFSLVSQGKDGNPLSSYVGALTSQAAFITYQTEYVPLGANGQIFLTTVTPASTEVLITLIFRRKLERYISTIPQIKPHGHTPLSSRNQRTFYGGFDEALYKIGTPINPSPDEDTSMTGTAGTRHSAAGNVGIAVPKAGGNPMERLDRKVSSRFMRGKRVG